MAESRLIEPWGVYGKGPIRLEIPNSGECLGMKEFFESLFSSRDQLFGNDYERFEKTPSGSRATFKLDELAEAAFGYYDPQEFADAILPKLDPKGEQSEDLYKRIVGFEEKRKSMYMKHYHLDNHGHAYYFSPKSNMSPEEVKGVIRIVWQGFQSKTKRRRTYLNIPRENIIEDGLPHQASIVGIMPVNFYRNSAQKLRDRIINSKSSPVIYYCEHTPSLNLNPFALLKRFPEIDTSDFKIVRK